MCGTCTCPLYYKQYICKHLIGLAVNLTLATAPLAAKTVPLGKKRRPGRPAICMLALLRQPRNSILPLTPLNHDDNDDDQIITAIAAIEADSYEELAREPMEQLIIVATTETRSATPELGQVLFTDEYMATL